jgi:protein-S-isoprenylcysteine O-methyltransferase Ste14
MNTGAAQDKAGTAMALALLVGGWGVGSLLALVAIVALSASAGSWVSALGTVAVALGSGGVLLFIRVLRRRKSCELKQKETVND